MPNEHRIPALPTRPDVLSTPTPVGLAATATYLDGLRAAFPTFRIWREITRDRIVYVARRRQPGTRLHTLVTRDPQELRVALAGACPAEPSYDPAPR